MRGACAYFRKPFNPLQEAILNRSNAEKTTMRLPDDVVSWLKARARHNVSSMTTEAVRAIRSQIARELREMDVADAERRQRASGERETRR
jgi:hypothetical protein